MAAGQIPNWFVVVMGLGTVFVGLISIVIILMIMGKIVQSATDKREAAVTASAANSQPIAQELTPEEHGRIVAAVAAVIAEELGTDISAIRICSMKRVSQ
mgnify:CR=1 FL=1